MSFAAAILWSLLRSIAVASFAVAPATLLVARLETVRGIATRRLLIALALIPLFVPELLIGFHYRLVIPQLTAGLTPAVANAGTELLYLALQWSRALAVGIAMMLLLPDSPITRESMHAWTLLRQSLAPAAWRLGHLRLLLTGPWRAGLVAWSVMALMSFQEFESAALMQLDRSPVAWTVTLFDLHAARQPVSSSLTMVLGPLICELALLAPAVVVLLLTSGMASSTDTAADVQTHSSQRYSWLVLLLPGLVLVLFWPVVANAEATAAGLRTLLTGSLLSQSLEQIATSSGFAIASAILAMTIGGSIVDRFQARPLDVPGALLVLMSLTGSLVLSLLLLAAFQLPLFRVAYDTWLPLLLGQSLAALPRAIALLLLLRTTTDSAAVHSARLLFHASNATTRRDAARIVWRLTTGRWLLAALVLTHWCFWDVTVASILRPVQLEPVVTRLYNEMHYGRTEALMSLSLLAAMTPIVLAGLMMFGSRLLPTNRAPS